MSKNINQWHNLKYLKIIFRFFCDEGFALIGSPVLDCEDDGNNDVTGAWSDVAPVCQGNLIIIIWWNF